MADGIEKPGPTDAPGEDGLAPRVLAAKAMPDNLAQGQHQIGKGLDRPAHDPLHLVEAEAEPARAVLATIIAELQPAMPEEMALDGSLQRLMAMAGPSLARELVDKLGADLASVDVALRDAGAAADWASLGGQSHILIALAGAAGARQLQTAAEAVNRIALQSDPDALHQALPGCLSMIAALRNKIRSLPLPEEGPAQIGRAHV